MEDLGVIVTPISAFIGISSQEKFNLKCFDGRKAARKIESLSKRLEYGLRSFLEAKYPVLRESIILSDAKEFIA